jgi:O-antigen ligase
MKDIMIKSLNRLAHFRLTLVQTFNTPEIIMIGLVFCLFTSMYAAIASLLALAVYLVRKNLPAGLEGDRSTVRILVVFVTLSFSVSALYNNLPGMLIALGLGVIFLTMLYIRSVMNDRLMQAMIKSCCMASWFSAVVVIIEKLIHAGAADNYRAGSTFVNANIYATVIEIVVLFCASQLLHVKRSDRWFYVVTLAANLVGLYLCNCRTATAALAIAVLALMVLNRRWRAMGKTLVVIMAFVTAVYILPDMSFRISHVGNDLQLRQMIWQTALKGILASPLFGEGGLAYALVYRQYGGPAAIHAHSLFIDPILNFGLVGVGLLLACFVRFFRSLHQKGQRAADRRPYRLIISILLCVMVHGLVDITIFNVQAGLLFLISLSFAGVYESQPARTQIGLASRRNLAA